MMSEEENHQFEKIKQLINAALSLNDAEEYEKAKEIGLLALELDPEFSTIHVLLGLSHQGLGQNSEAESYFRKAIELDEYNENALQSLGLLLLSRDKKEEGVDYLLKYLKLNNWEDTDNVRIVVDTLDKLNRQVEAMELLKDCWENKKQPEISEDLFLRLLVFGTKDDAFIVLKEAAEISGESGEYFNLATHEMLFNRYHDAINSLEMAFSLEAELGLAEPGFSYEEYLDAGETWPEYWPDEEKLSTYEYFIAKCYLHLNEGEKALAAINRSIEIIPYKFSGDYSVKAEALI